jgi:hypothetical protein
MTPQRPITTVKNAKADYNSYEEGKILVGDVEEAVQLSALGNPLEWAASSGRKYLSRVSTGIQGVGRRGVKQAAGSHVACELGPRPAR